MADVSIGIDLGTTHSVVAVFRDGSPEILHTARDTALVPSVVALDDGGRLLVGEAAAERQRAGSPNAISRFKSAMGTDASFSLGSRSLSATSLSALVLREMRQVASEALGDPVERAVISVPAWFREPQRAATVEAAHLAGDRAPGLGRAFALQRWIDADRSAWRGLQEEAAQRWEVGRAAIPPIVGNDRDPDVIATARASIARAGLEQHITLSNSPIADYRPTIQPAVVVVNPPYGVRLDPADLSDGWSQLGRFLKDLGQGEAWILSGDAELSRALRLKADTKIPILNGGLDCRWMRYPLRPRGASTP